VPLPPSPSAPFSAASPTYAVARCIAIIDRPLSLGVPAPAAPSEEPTPFEDAANDDASIPDPPPSSPALDAAVLVFPPSSLPTGTGSSNAAATALVTGEGTMSCPKGKCSSFRSLVLSSFRFVSCFSNLVLLLSISSADQRRAQGSSTSRSPS
jgi:hypothetical protein